MFSKTTALLFTSSLAILAAAAPNPDYVTVTVTQAPTATTISQCNTGDAQCCDSVLEGNDPAVSLLEGLLGIVVPDVNLLIGLTCTPISIIGGQGANCAQQPVCCTDNSFNGLINIGCNPISL